MVKLMNSKTFQKYDMHEKAIEMWNNWSSPSVMPRNVHNAQNTVTNIVLNIYVDN